MASSSILVILTPELALYYQIKYLSLISTLFARTTVKVVSEPPVLYLQPSFYALSGPGPHSWSVRSLLLTQQCVHRCVRNILLSFIPNLRRFQKKPQPLYKELHKNSPCKKMISNTLTYLVLLPVYSRYSPTMDLIQTYKQLEMKKIYGPAGYRYGSSATQRKRCNLIGMLLSQSL